MGRPLGSRGISLNTGEIDGRLIVSASFHPEMLAAELVQDLVTMMATSIPASS
jgi:hypothetical protein